MGGGRTVKGGTDEGRRGGMKVGGEGEGSSAA